MKRTRDITVRPANHRCNADPSKNYGISSPRVVFTLKVGKEAISWELHTDWGMPDEAFHAACPDCTHPAHQRGFPISRTGALVGAVDWHFAEDVVGGMPYCENCVVLGGPCWADVGYLIGDDLYDLLRLEGSEAVWTRMEELLVGYRAEVDA